MKQIWLSIVIGFAMLFVGLFWLGSIVKAQKAERGTQQWRIEVNSLRSLTVIDTAGVCLYIAAGAYDSSPAIAAVPKTQLPQGVGCQ